MKMSLLVLFTHQNLLLRGLAIIGFEALLGSPGPAAFTARTRNSYSVPSSRLPAVPLQSGPASPAFTQRVVPFSFFSITYPVIGDPPS